MKCSCFLYSTAILISVSSVLFSFAICFLTIWAEALAVLKMGPNILDQNYISFLFKFRLNFSICWAFKPWGSKVQSVSIQQLPVSPTYYHITCASIYIYISPTIVLWTQMCQDRVDSVVTLRGKYFWGRPISGTFYMIYMIYRPIGEGRGLIICDPQTICFIHMLYVLKKCIC